MSIGLGMYAAGYAHADFGFFHGSGGGAFPPDSLCFTLPVQYRHRVNKWFAAGGEVAVLVWHFKDSGTMGGVEIGGGIRPYLVPDWLYVDFSLFVGFPLYYGWMPTLGLTIPLGGSVSLMIENQFPMTYLFGVFLVIYQPVLGVEFAF